MSDEFDYAFRYFELHAKQRMSTFNFFIVLSAFLITSFVATYQSGFLYPSLSYLVSLAMMIVSVIFWKLDQRVKFLIRHAEEILENLEKNSTQVRLFSTEREKSSAQKNTVWQGVIREQLSYSQCFGAMYIMFFVLGFICYLIRASGIF